MTRPERPISPTSSVVAQQMLHSFYENSGLPVKQQKEEIFVLINANFTFNFSTNEFEISPPIGCMKILAIERFGLREILVNIA